MNERPATNGGQGEGAEVSGGHFPMAEVSESKGANWSWIRRMSRLWIITRACFAVALILVIYSVRTTGLDVKIHFRDGHGIQPGDAVRFRGIDIGKVLSVELDRELNGVDVTVSLNPAAAGLARQGSQFWVERPRVSAAELRGLDTLFGGRFVGVAPGPTDAPRAVEFSGIDSAPAGELPEGGLEIVLEAKQRGGLQRGAPILFRGLQIGHIISAGLATDSATVEARTYVLPEYKPLVRDNSVFWNPSGLDLSVGLSGIQLSVDTLATIALGGISMATPNSAGNIVTTGHRFHIEEEIDRKQLARWNPRIPIGNLSLLSHGTPPQPLRASLSWKENSFGIQHTRRRQGWILPLEEAQLLGPTDMFSSNLQDGDSMDTALELEGEIVEIAKDQKRTYGAIAVYALQDSLFSAQRSWPKKRTRPPTEPEDCLVVASPHASPVPLAAGRLRLVDGVWKVDPAIPLGADWHGGCVVAANNGDLIGILVVDGGDANIVPLRAL